MSELVIISEIFGRRDWFQAAVAGRLGQSSGSFLHLSVVPIIISNNKVLAFLWV